jgi:Tol biopolymer transport system component
LIDPVRLLTVAGVAVGVLVVAPAAREAPPAPPFLTYTSAPRGVVNGQYRICIVPPDSPPVQIVSGSLSASAAAWRPDGERVAFAGWKLPPELRSEDDGDIVVADARGRLLRNLTAGFSQSNFNPKWSPDGRWIAFVSDALVPRIVAADGSEPPKLLPVHDFAGDVNWFPDGRRLVISGFLGGRVGVFAVNSNGSGVKRLTSGAQAAVSPDGRRLAFVRRTRRGRFVYVARANGSHARRLTRSARSESDPAWSPDGEWIAFEQMINPRAVVSHRRIVVARVDRTASYVAVSDERYEPYYPSWRRGATLPETQRPSC